MGVAKQAESLLSREMADSDFAGMVRDQETPVRKRPAGGSISDLGMRTGTGSRIDYYY